MLLVKIQPLDSAIFSQLLWRELAFQPTKQPQYYNASIKKIEKIALAFAPFAILIVIP
jgi:hypothetical protein